MLYLFKKKIIIYLTVLNVKEAGAEYPIVLLKVGTLILIGSIAVYKGVSLEFINALYLFKYLFCSLQLIFEIESINLKLIYMN